VPAHQALHLTGPALQFSATSSRLQPARQVSPVDRQPNGYRGLSRNWNAELVRGDLAKAVQQLRQESGKGLLVGGVKLPLALAELGLIDEYEFVVQPRLAGHGPTLFAGLSKCIDLRLVSRLEFRSGAVAMRYEPRR
jgi:dihydrofolate reductase